MPECLQFHPTFQSEWADGRFSLELFKRQMTVEGKTPWNTMTPTHTFHFLAVLNKKNCRLAKLSGGKDAEKNLC